MRQAPNSNEIIVEDTITSAAAAAAMTSSTAAGGSSSSSLPSTSQLWRITSGKNGEKYLTFANSNSSSRRRRRRGDSNDDDGEENGDDDDDGGNESSLTTIRVYKMRWFILLCICMAQISNSINWICYSPIADFVGQFYSVDYSQVNWLSLSYLVITVPTGLFSVWIADNFGIRSSINVGVWLNMGGSLVRALSSLDSANGSPLIAQHLKYGFLIGGQCVCALAQPFIMFVTTKFANTWFADDQRALANTLALGSNTLGILIGSFMSPQIVDSSVEFVSEMSLLNLICLAVSIAPTVLSGFITRSTPKSPPSYSAIINQSNESSGGVGVGEYMVQNDDDDNSPNRRSAMAVYFSQIGKLFRSKDFLVLMFSFGMALGLFNALTTLIEQILCVRGYTDIDVGYFGGAMIVSGIIGSILAGIALDKTKRFEEIAKLCFGLSSLGGIFFCIMQLYNNDKGLVYYLILLAFIWVGFFGLPLLPVCMEMSVECVYPIPEATTTGILFMGGQVVGILMILLYPVTASKLDPNSYQYEFVQTCQTSGNGTSSSSTISSSTISTSTKPGNLSVLDFTNQMYFQSIAQVLVAIVFILFFKCAYLRLRSEREKLAEKILNSARV